MLKKFLYLIFSPLLKKVNLFEGIHKGETCYLIGDGVSVKWFDLKKFSDKISIPVGYISFHNDYNFLKTPYSLLIEPFWFYPLFKTTTPPIKSIINHIQKIYRTTIRLQKSTNFFINLSNFPVTLFYRNVTYLFRNIPNTDLVKSFLDKGIDPFSGSFRASILLAIYLGFDNIYLVGYDYTHSPSKIQHWYEKGEGTIKNYPEYEKEFIEIAKQHIYIKTVTVDGISDKIDYISYKDLTGCDPLYKENFEIISDKYLKALSTWHNYKIY